MNLWCPLCGEELEHNALDHDGETHNVCRRVAHLDDLEDRRRQNRAGY